MSTKQIVTKLLNEAQEMEDKAETLRCLAADVEDNGRLGARAILILQQIAHLASTWTEEPDEA